MWFKLFVVIALLVSAFIDYILWFKIEEPEPLPQVLMACKPKKIQPHSHNIHMICIPHELTEKSLDENQ